jgi:hypothetical protein
MKFLVWCTDIDTAHLGKQIEAANAEKAARELFAELDSGSIAFPEENNGDECTIAVAPWTLLNEDDDEPEHEIFTFRLIIERSVHLV